MKEEGEGVKAKQEELDAVKVNFTKVGSQLARQELVVLTGSIFLGGRGGGSGGAVWIAKVY